MNDDTNIFLQWKGTDACFDFSCDCGAYSHHDGMFIYFIKCSTCGAVYEMPQHLLAVRVDPGNPPEYYVPGEEHIGVTD